MCSNVDLEKMVDMLDEWIVIWIGICEWCIVGLDEIVVSMGFQVVKKVLEMVVIDEGIDKKDIGLIIVVIILLSYVFLSLVC